MEQVVRQMEQGSAETGGILEQSISRIQNDDRVSLSPQLTPSPRSQPPTSSPSTIFLNVCLFRIR